MMVEGDSQVTVDMKLKVVRELENRWDAYDWNQGVRRVCFALVVGAIMGLIGVVICKAVDWATSLWLPQNMRWLLLLLPLFSLVALALYKALHLRRLIYGDPTVNRIVEDIDTNKAYPPQAGPAMFLATLLSLAGGASVGPEGAAKEMGASIGGLFVKVFGLKMPEKPSYDAIAFAMASGMAACFAAVLMAPVGIIVYALVWARNNKRTVRRWPTISLCVFTACAVSYPFHAYFTNPVVRPEALDPATLSSTIIVALVVGIASLFYHLVRLVLEKGLRSRITNPYLSVLIGSCVILAIYFLWPSTQEMGGISTNLLRDSFAGTAPDWAFAAKILLTALALGFGLRGGEVTVLIISGAALGCSVAHALCAIPFFADGGVSLTALCALGLSGLFGVGDKCPVAAAVVGIEFFGLALAPYIILTMLVAWYLEKGVMALISDAMKACGTH